MPEAAGVHELVNDDPSVDTAITQADLLSRPGPTYAARAPAALHDVDVAPLRGARDEPDAGLLVVLLHGLGDDTPLSAVEGAGDDVGDDTPGPLPPAVPDGIPGSLALH